eukprot:5755268-Prymnesium_polylepis.1
MPSHARHAASESIWILLHFDGPVRASSAWLRCKTSVGPQSRTSREFHLALALWAIQIHSVVTALDRLRASASLSDASPMA